MTSGPALLAVDVAAAGGWKTVTTLKTAYQQADAPEQNGAIVGRSTYTGPSLSWESTCFASV